MISIKEVSYKNYGKCVCVSNDTMELYVTVDLGPRIIKCNLLNKENLLYEDIDRTMQNDVSDIFGENKTFYNYGGHRLWFSPESMNTYYPDNEKVVYTVDATGVTLIPPQQEVNELQYSFRIDIDENKPIAKITHQIKNVSNRRKTYAAWALSVMKSDGAVIIPQRKDKTGLLANRKLILWDYTKINDERLILGDEYIALRQNPAISAAIKIGTNNSDGKIAYVNSGCALIKSYKPWYDGGNYVDFGVNCESYANGIFIEAETISELCDVNPDESVIHEEYWHLKEYTSNLTNDIDGITKIAREIFE